MQPRPWYLWIALALHCPAHTLAVRRRHPPHQADVHSPCPAMPPAGPEQCGPAWCSPGVRSNSLQQLISRLYLLFSLRKSWKMLEKKITKYNIATRLYCKLSRPGPSCTEIVLPVWIVPINIVEGNNSKQLLFVLHKSCIIIIIILIIKKLINIKQKVDKAKENKCYASVLSWSSNRPNCACACSENKNPNALQQSARQVQCLTL